jgi:hypothetical protein|nr:MAG TPA: hypothetical protein [Caudoviricetes sp.]
MSELSKELHMFVANQWVRGNAATPGVAKAGCSHWFPGGVTEVAVGSKYKYFQGATPAEVTQMLKGAGWYGPHAKAAQRILQGAEFEQMEVRLAVSYLNKVFVKVGDAVDFLKYGRGNSPALFLLAAYRKLKKAKEAEKLVQAAAFVERYGARPRKLGDLMPERGHTSRMQGPDINVQTLPKPQKLNTLLLHRDLVNALEAVNRVLHWGCNERQPPYPETGWKDVPLDKYKQALLRHQSEWLKDPMSLDDESGKLHLAHMATNALILLQRWPEEGKSGSTDH